METFFSPTTLGLRAAVGFMKDWQMNIFEQAGEAVFLAHQGRQQIAAALVAGRPRFLRWLSRLFS